MDVEEEEEEKEEEPTPMDVEEEEEEEERLIDRDSRIVSQKEAGSILTKWAANIPKWKQISSLGDVGVRALANYAKATAEIRAMFKAHPSNDIASQITCADHVKRLYDEMIQTQRVEKRSRKEMQTEQKQKCLGCDKYVVISPGNEDCNQCHIKHTVEQTHDTFQIRYKLFSKDEHEAHKDLWCKFTTCSQDIENADQVTQQMLDSWVRDKDILDNVLPAADPDYIPGEEEEEEEAEPEEEEDEPEEEEEEEEADAEEEKEEEESQNGGVMWRINRMENILFGKGTTTSGNYYMINRSGVILDQCYPTYKRAKVGQQLHPKGEATILCIREID